MLLRLPLLCTPLLSIVAICLAQERVVRVPATPADMSADSETIAQVDRPPANYVLGPDDQISLYISDAEEISGKPMRIDMKGDINLPMTGRIHAAGLTSEQLEAAIKDRMKRFFQEPDVVISITEFRSQPISVLGAVNTPGVHQLQGRKTLFEVLSAAGGLRQDAGTTVKITRKLKWGRIPLPTAKDDLSGQFSVASVNVKSITKATNPIENIAIKPEDVISVPREDLVYVVGSVKKPGGFVMGENESLSALQVLSLAEGLEKTAAPARARIMRAVTGTTNRTEIAVNLKNLMAGKGPDLPLRADDILFIPDSAAKSAGTRAAEAVIQIATGMAVYGRY